MLRVCLRLGRIATKESVELAASRVERVLLRFADARVDERRCVAADKLLKGVPGVLSSKRLVVVSTSYQLAAERPEVVAMSGDSLARQPLIEEAEKEGREHRDDLLTNRDIGLVVSPRLGPVRQVWTSPK